MQIYSNYILYQYCKKIEENRLLEIFLTYFGFSLMIIPALIIRKYASSDSPTKNIESDKNSENAKSRPTKNESYNNTKITDIIIFFSISILHLAVHFAYILVELLNGYYKEEYFILEILIWLIAPKFILKKTYYKHQKLAILLIIIIGIIKSIIEIVAFEKYNYKQILLEIFIHIGDSIFFGYIKILMEFKYYSPFQCCYLFGFVNTPLILIIYFIVSHIPCNNKFLCDGKKLFDNIYTLFDNLTFNESILLILECFSEGIGILTINTIMNKFTIYHVLAPFLITFSIINLLDKEKSAIEIIISVIFLVLEIIFILIFIEVIELNFWNLNENLKINIEERALHEEIYNKKNEDMIIFLDDEKNYYINSDMLFKN